MKNNKKTIYSALTVVTALLAQLPATAQETADSALVNVAFKKAQKSDVLGGVSTVNVRDLTEKNYNTYSLDNMQGYVSGYNGNSLWGYSNALVLMMVCLVLPTMYVLMRLRISLSSRVRRLRCSMEAVQPMVSS